MRIICKFDEFKKMEMKQGQHVIGLERLHEREDCLLRQAYKDSELRPTYAKITDKRK